MVRLKEKEIAIEQSRKINFNSNMVRLKAF